MAKNNVEVLDASRVLFGCKDCGGRWSPMLQEGGELPHGSYTCPHCGV